eukprot:7513176-Alexandrium_andersonii.AAC.1
MRRIPSEAPGRAATPYDSHEGVLHAGSPSQGRSHSSASDTDEGVLRVHDGVGIGGWTGSSRAASPSETHEGVLRSRSPSVVCVRQAAGAGRGAG